MFIIKIIIIIIYLTYFLISLKTFNNIRVCICTIGKKENLYAKEFVEYYKKMGINKIFIYDNNEKNDEKFDIILKDYIDNGFVKIVDYRGFNKPHVSAIEDCRKKNFKLFDWLIFYDMDEFLFLRNFSNINDFLRQKIFDKCQRIQLNWYFHTDNNLIYYDNRTLAERFPEKEKKWKKKKLGGIEGIKSILKGNIDLKIYDVHILNSKLISCDGFGNIKQIQKIVTNTSDHYYNYIDHYYCKSTEEFVNKIMRGSAVHGNFTKNHLDRLRGYFAISEITLEKINYLENKTNLNLSIYRIMLKNKTKMHK